MSEICNLIVLNGELNLNTLGNTLTVKPNRKASLILTECFIEITENISVTGNAEIQLKKNSQTLGVLKLVNAESKGNLKFFDLLNNSEIISLEPTDNIIFECTSVAVSGKIRAFIGIK